jgi:transposase
MGNPTTQEQRQRIVQLSKAGYSDAKIGQQLGISRFTARKWRRRVFKLTISGLESRIGRPTAGTLSSFSNELNNLIHTWCHENPTWGAQTLRSELEKHPKWGGLTIPSISTINKFLKEERLRVSERCSNEKGTKISERLSNRNKTKLFDVDQHQLWIIKLMQGKIDYAELNRTLSDRLESDVIQQLRDHIIYDPLSYRNRAVTIIAYYKGISKTTISASLFLTLKSVRKYIKLFETEGSEGLFTWGWPRVKKVKNLKYIDAVFSILHEPPSLHDFNRTTWRMKDIRQVISQQGLDVSEGSIGKIISNAGYRIRQAKEVLTSNDPDYKEKIKYITDILSNLGEKEKFFSIDEYGPFAIKIQGGRSLMPPGKTKKIPQWQESKGSLIITGALELSTNQITHFYSDSKDTQEMIKLIEILLEQYKSEECLYISWDAASWHDSNALNKKVEELNHPDYRGAKGTPMVKLAPLPASAQFLNVIESVFSGMARAIIHNSDYQSVEECKQAINRHFTERNQFFKENPKKAGKKIWGQERVESQFRDSNNCKDPKYSR